MEKRQSEGGEEDTYLDPKVKTAHRCHCSTLAAHGPHRAEGVFLQLARPGRPGAKVPRSKRMGH